MAGGEEEELEAVEPAQARRGAGGRRPAGVLRRPAAETTARPASSDAMAAWAPGPARVSSSPTALHGRPWRRTSKEAAGLGREHGIAPLMCGPTAASGTTNG